MTTPPSLTTPLAGLDSPLCAHIRQSIAQQQGWIGFDTFMHLALYAPGLGYYTSGKPIFGTLPHSAKGQGSDFVTAPEISRFFGRALATQVAQALQVTQTRQVWEFGAGSGALALQLLDALQAMGQPLEAYSIVDVSGSLKARQQQTLAAHAPVVSWVSELPQAISGVVVGNEVLDAMPVKLLARLKGIWYERGVAVRKGAQDSEATFVWADRPTDLRPPLEIAGEHDYITEIHPQAEAFVRTLGERMASGAAFLLDYGFPEHEYYHVQRDSGTVMCHRAHQSDTNPLVDVGLKDITVHVNFTGIALAAQEIAGAGVLGYTSQARFLLNCGLMDLLENATLPERAMAHKLIMEHEMGELFKVMGLFKGKPWDALGFAAGDRTHKL